MKKIYVRFITTGKIYSYDPIGADEETLKLNPDQGVLVETDQIIEEGRVVPDSAAAESEEGTGRVVRAITPEDRQFRCQLKKMARSYIEEAEEKVLRNGLNMRILDADLSFDQKKLTFYFSAKGRIDFRGLVLDMAKSFNKLIRLQQVGARDVAKYFGGIGKCGRELCCSKFSCNAEAVTLEMAEAQEISTTGIGKITGCCGKLMCCLSFEVKNYPSELGRQAKTDKKVRLKRTR